MDTSLEEKQRLIAQTVLGDIDAAKVLLRIASRQEDWESCMTALMAITSLDLNWTHNAAAINIGEYFKNYFYEHIYNYVHYGNSDLIRVIKDQIVSSKQEESNSHDVNKVLNDNSLFLFDSTVDNHIHCFHTNVLNNGHKVSRHGSTKLSFLFYKNGKRPEPRDITLSFYIELATLDNSYYTSSFNTVFSNTYLFEIKNQIKVYEHMQSIYNNSADLFRNDNVIKVEIKCNTYKELNVRCDLLYQTEQ